VAADAAAGFAGNVRGGRIAGAGHVDNDRSGLGVFLFGDGGEGAEELVGDIGEEAARRVEMIEKRISDGSVLQLIRKWIGPGGPTPIGAGKSLGAAQNLAQENGKERKDRIDNGRVQHCTRNQNDL
jgi:hypothetical protein